MHIGPIPDKPTIQYTVHVPVNRLGVNGHTLYQRIGIAWPALKPAEEFRKAYEETHPRYADQLIIVEQVTTWTVITDYAHNRGQHGRLPTQRGLQRGRQDRDALEPGGVATNAQR